MERWKSIKAWVSATAAGLTALWGWFGWLAAAWVVSMALDVVTGMAAAVKRGEWSSRRAREGLWHKAGCVAAVTASGVLDLVVGQLLAGWPEGAPFSYTVLLCPLTVVWYMLSEMGSVIENAGAMGAPVPGWLKRAMAGLREQVDGKAE